MDDSKKIKDLEGRLDSLEKNKNEGRAPLSIGIFVDILSISGLALRPELRGPLGYVLFLGTTFALVGAYFLYKDHREYNECKNLLEMYEKNKGEIK